MSLKQQILDELKASMLAKNELKTSTLRMLKADIMKFEVSGADKEATDEVVADLVKKAIKQRREAADGFEKGGNAPAAQKERDEAKILEAYMPEQMSEEELKKVVQDVITQTGASGAGDFGKVMGMVMGKVKGQADGGMVGKVVKELLG